MVIDPVALVEELTMLTDNNVHYNGSIHIAANAHIVTPVHKWIDSVSEENSGHKIGTTCRGIGPAYVDKYNRCGIRAMDLNDLNNLKQKVMDRLDLAISSGELSESDRDDVTNEIEKFIEGSAVIAPMVEDTFSMLHEMVESHQNILLEGAQGTMLDINHGTYPFVTSSSPSTGGIATGLGLPLTKVNRIMGIFKSYTTRVGKGPFPTELFDEDGTKLQDFGKEFGATTGRPRRCGWFDAVEAKYSVQINGFTEITLTKLDILDHFDTIKVCTVYECGGAQTDRMSKLISDLSDVKPIYKTFEGWNQPTTGIDAYDKLPEKTQEYIMFIADFIGVPVKIISTGPGRDEIIQIN
jgi:adenylosuccinate synthase